MYVTFVLAHDTAPVAARKRATFDRRDLSTRRHRRCRARASRRSRPGQEGGALPLTADWGLHPALAESMLPLYQQHQLAFVPFAGTDDLSRSHFDTQDSIELGQPLGGRRDYRSGFLNRLVAELNPRTDSAGETLQPMAFTSTLLRATTGGLILLAAIDAPYQKWNWMRKLKMTRQELREEMKESEGSRK